MITALVIALFVGAVAVTAGMADVRIGLMRATRGCAGRPGCHSMACQQCALYKLCREF
jgi:hypothetical protein